MVTHTHPDIKDKLIRQIMANELWILRRSLRASGEQRRSDWAMGIRLGLDTFARRMQYAQGGK